MNELTASNLEVIMNDVRRQRITFSHLCDELIDHICCEVEDEMQLGLNFEKAYHKVKGQIGGRRLNEIQEETLYLVDKKYRRMKNTMKFTGISGTVLLGFAGLFKIMHWPLAGVMLVVGTFLLVAFFMPSSMLVLWKESKSGKHLLLFVSAFMAATLFIVGVLFKVQHWPGSGVIISLSMLSALVFLPALLWVKLRDEENRKKWTLYIAATITALLFLLALWSRIMHWPYAMVTFFPAIVLFVIVFPWYVFLEWKENKTVSAVFIFIVIAMIAYIVPSSLINLNLQVNYNEGFYQRADKKEALINIQVKSNEKFLARYSDFPVYDTLQKIHEISKATLKQIDRVTTRLIDISGGYKGGFANGSRIDIRTLDKPFDQESVAVLLLPGCPERMEIERSLAGLIKEIGNYSGNENYLREQNLSGLLALLPDKEADPERNTLIAALDALSLLKSAVLDMESQALLQLTTRGVEQL